MEPSNTTTSTTTTTTTKNLYPENKFEKLRYQFHLKRTSFSRNILPCFLIPLQLFVYSLALALDQN